MGQLHVGNGDRFAFVDLFAGIGGLRLGLESNGGTCVFTCEIDKFCRQTYQANHGDADIFNDIRDLDPKDIPEHDILAAGFPCQPFSLAGVPKKNSLGQPHGFACKTQGTMFGELVRIIDEKRPRLLLLENVRNLLSHDKGRTFEIIHHALSEELGYHVSWRLLSAEPWVPQKRVRLFIVCDRDRVVDLEELAIPDPVPSPTMGDILHPENGEEQPEPPYTTEPSGVVAAKYVLSDRLWAYLQHHARQHRAAGNGFGYSLTGRGDVARTLTARYGKDGAEILIENGSDNPRRLTPRECSRLMGFDTPTGSSFKIPVSDTQAYRQFGNSVAVPLVRHLGGFLAERL